MGVTESQSNRYKVVVLTTSIQGQLCNEWDQSGTQGALIHRELRRFLIGWNRDNFSRDKINGQSMRVLPNTYNHFNIFHTNRNINLTHILSSLSDTWSRKRIYPRGRLQCLHSSHLGHAITCQWWKVIQRGIHDKCQWESHSGRPRCSATRKCHLQWKIIYHHPSVPWKRWNVSEQVTRDPGLSSQAGLFQSHILIRQAAQESIITWQRNI